MLSEVTTKNKIERVLWQCRRGMLELDKILIKFVNKFYMQMSEEKKQIFQELLQFPDQDLLQFLVGNELPADTKFWDIILVIRA